MAERIEGVIESIDELGNLVTDIDAARLDAAPTDERTVVRCDEHQTHGLFRDYADQPPMTLIARVVPGGRLKLAIVNDSAAEMLGVRVGEKVVVQWP